MLSIYFLDVLLLLANDVAENIMAMDDKNRPSDFLCINRWFKAVPVYERAMYRARVVDCLMLLSVDGKAKVEIGISIVSCVTARCILRYNQDRILRHCEVPVFVFDEKHTTAVLMAMHARLGANSALAALGDQISVIARYAEY